MGRTLSLVGVVVFAVGVVALSSLARQTRQISAAKLPRDHAPTPGPRLRPRLIPAFAFDNPFSVN